MAGHVLDGHHGVGSMIFRKPVVVCREEASAACAPRKVLQNCCCNGGSIRGGSASAELIQSDQAVGGGSLQRGRSLCQLHKES